MVQRAGVALSRLAYDADFAISRFDYDPEPRYNKFLPPAHHKLVEAHTVEEIFDTFCEVIGRDTTLEYIPFSVSIPISASAEQKEAFLDANTYNSRDHLEAWAYLYSERVGNVEGTINLLFIDLTPGQVASKLVSRNDFFFESRVQLHEDGYTCLGDVDSLTTPELYEKLVRTIVPTNTKLHRVGILRREGAFPAITISALEAIFEDTPVDWVTLEDLSYGTAFVMIHEPICAVPWTAWAGSLYIPIGVILSNGGVVKVVPTDEYFPIRKTVIFTNSQDNQTTVAIQLCRGTEPVDKVKLEGLLPRPKGRARVKVEINIRDWNDITATVQEVGTDLKKIKAFGENIIWEPGCIRTHEQTTIEMVEMTLGEDGVIGELPE